MTTTEVTATQLTATGMADGTVRASDAAVARVLNRVALLVLPVVAGVGAVLSWGSLYAAAAAALGAHAPVAVLDTPVGTWRVNLVGASFPLLVDALILGASARYVAGVKAGRPVAGWRLAAHAGVAGTVLLNADAAPTLADVPWHITAPIVWSVLVELVARDVLGQLRHTHGLAAERIPARLWLTAPTESVRVSWRMARTGLTDAAAVRVATERCAAAQDMLTAALPGRAHARIRRQITRRLWSGALDPTTLAHLLETTGDPAGLHRTVLRSVATATPPAAPQSTPTGAPDPAPMGAPDPAPMGAPDPAPRGAPSSGAAKPAAARGPRRTATSRATTSGSTGSGVVRADDATLAALVARVRAEHAAGERAGAGERAVRELLRAAGLSASNDRVRQALAAGPTRHSDDGPHSDDRHDGPHGLVPSAGHAPEQSKPEQSKEEDAA